MLGIPSLFWYLLVYPNLNPLVGNGKYIMSAGVRKVHIKMRGEVTEQ